MIHCKHDASQDNNLNYRYHEYCSVTQNTVTVYYLWVSLGLVCSAQRVLVAESAFCHKGSNEKKGLWGWFSDRWRCVVNLSTPSAGTAPGYIPINHLQVRISEAFIYWNTQHTAIFTDFCDWSALCIRIISWSNRCDAQGHKSKIPFSIETYSLKSVL